MKLPYFLLLVLGAVCVSAATATETAYTALRAVGKQAGAESMNRVVEVRGRFGAPEPGVWKIVVEESASRGGIREYEVQRGRIIAERAPTSRSIGTVMDLNRLNIDSEGAFTIADKEARKAMVPFDRVDYTLRSSGRGSGSVWQVELIDGRNGRIGLLDISAESGDVLQKEFLTPRGASRTTAPPPVRDRPVARQGRGAPDDEELGPGITDLFGKMSRHFNRRGKQLKSFFNGEGWHSEY